MFKDVFVTFFFLHHLWLPPRASSLHPMSQQNNEGKWQKITSTAKYARTASNSFSIGSSIWFAHTMWDYDRYDGMVEYHRDSDTITPQSESPITKKIFERTTNRVKNIVNKTNIEECDILPVAEENEDVEFISNCPGMKWNDGPSLEDVLSDKASREHIEYPFLLTVTYFYQTSCVIVGKVRRGMVSVVEIVRRTTTIIAFHPIAPIHIIVKCDRIYHVGRVLTPFHRLCKGKSLHFAISIAWSQKFTVNQSNGNLFGDYRKYRAMTRNKAIFASIARARCTSFCCIWSSWESDSCVWGTFDPSLTLSTTDILHDKECIPIICCQTKWYIFQLQISMCWSTQKLPSGPLCRCLLTRLFYHDYDFAFGCAVSDGNDGITWQCVVAIWICVICALCCYVQDICVAKSAWYTVYVCDKYSNIRLLLCTKVVILTVVWTGSDCVWKQFF